MVEKYKKLKKIESKVDGLCLSKRLHTEAEHLKRIKCIKTLRLYIKSSIKEETFIRIDTRVINDFKNQTEMKAEDLVKRLCVVFNSDLTPSIEYYARMASDEEIKEEKPSGDAKCEVYEWNNNEEGFTAFELRSKSIPENIRLLVEFENKRNLYRLSPSLREITENYTDTKPNVITAIWKYVHKNGLIKPGDIEIVSNERLKALSGKDKFLFTDIPEIITNHLCPIDFLVVDIPLKEFQEEIVDIPIEVDDLYHLPRVHSKDVYAYEKKIEMVEDYKKRLEEKRDTLIRFEKNPIDFINRWICLESTDYYLKTNFLLDSNIREILYDLVQTIPDL